MESKFLEQWNAKFGAKPPEWVFNFTSQYSGQSLLEQDVDRELDKCQARIDKLRADLDQELFLVEWLRQQKASYLPKPPTSSKTQTPHVQFKNPAGLGFCTQVDDQSVEDSSELEDRPKGGKETPPKPSTLLALTRRHSPGSQLRSHSEESFKSTPDSSEYHTAPQSASEDTSETDLEDQLKEPETETVSVDEVKENGLSGSPKVTCRHRFAHKVNSSDVTIAKTVNKRLSEQRVHWSCNVLSLDSECGSCDKSVSADNPLLPGTRKRCASDPSFQRTKGIDLLPPTFELKDQCGERVLSSPVDSPLLYKKLLEKVDDSVKNNLIQSAQESSTTASKELEKLSNNRKEGSDSETIMMSEVEKRSSKEEESIELRQWANLGPGKRGSNGILDNYEGYNIIVSPDGEQDPALLNVLAGQMRSSAHSTPRSSVDHLRDPPTEVATTNGDNKRKDDTSRTPIHSTSEDLSPQRPAYNTQQTLVAEMSPGRGIPPALTKPERGSLVFSEDECITPKGDSSDHSMNLPVEEEDPKRKERSRTLVENEEGVKETLSTQNVSRVERLLEEVRRTQDQEGEDDEAMMTLTRKTTSKYHGYDVDPVFDQQELTPLGSLDIDIQETLSKIQSTPDMSMATLLDVKENEVMNARLPPAFADPSFEDFEYSESMEIDEATISALTLSNELFGSRSNSVTSLPGLYSGTESNVSTSPPDMDSPSHTRQGVNLRHTGGARRRDRKRMGNAELDIIAVASDEGSDLSPSHTVSSRSMSPTSELGSMVSLPISPASPREFSGSDSSGGIIDTLVSNNDG